MSTEAIKRIDHLARALKAPRIQEAAARLADQARDAGWTHEEYLAAVLDREVAAREASGSELRIRAAGFPARKTIEDYVFDHQPALRRDAILHLAGGGFLSEAENVVLLGPRAPARPTSPQPSDTRPSGQGTPSASRPPPGSWPTSPAATRTGAGPTACAPTPSPTC